MQIFLKQKVSLIATIVTLQSGAVPLKQPFKYRVSSTVAFITVDIPVHVLS